MCLSKKKPIRNKTYSEKEILNMFKTVKKKKTVYKVFEINKREDFISIKSPYQGSRYYLNQKYKSDITIDRDHELCGHIHIQRGIHAFVSPKRSLRRFRHVLDNTYILLPCTIPAGAKYLIGDDNEIVTDTLILPESFIYKGEEYNINY